jgi:protein subunit release factor B
MIIPPEELDFQAIRAQDSGWQNVNKSLVVVCR